MLFAYKIISILSVLFTFFWELNFFQSLFTVMGGWGKNIFLNCPWRTRGNGMKLLYIVFRVILFGRGLFNLYIFKTQVTSFFVLVLHWAIIWRKRKEGDYLSLFTVLFSVKKVNKGTFRNRANRGGIQMKTDARSCERNLCNCVKQPASHQHHEVMGSKSVEALDFSGFFTQWHKLGSQLRGSVFISFPQFIYDLFHIHQRWYRWFRSSKDRRRTTSEWHCNLKKTSWTHSAVNESCVISVSSSDSFSYIWHASCFLLFFFCFKNILFFSYFC